LKINFFFLTSVVLCAGLLSSCSSFETTPHRAFSAKGEWVVETPRETNPGYRKINRSSPLQFQHPKYGALILQGNSIDGVTALAAESGRLIWRAKINNGIEASLALHDQDLFAAGGDGYLHSLSALTGQSNWSFPMRNEGLSEPVYEDGLVLVLSAGNTIFAVDAKSGKQQWLYARQDTQSISVRGGSRPAVKNGLAVVGFSDGSVVALNLKTGNVKWEKQLNRNKRFRDIDSDSLIDDDFVYLSGFDNAIYCLRVNSGELVWRFDRGGYGAPILKGETLIVPGTQGELLALDRVSGKKLWAHEVKKGIPTSAKLYKGLVVFGETQGALKFLDSGTGALVGQFDPGRGVFSSPSVDEKNGRVFFISNEANAYSVKAGWENSVQIPYLR
jgi:outer membrane protein assembly factor BamB